MRWMRCFYKPKMTKNTDYGRREFLKKAGLGVLGFGIGDFALGSLNKEAEATQKPIPEIRKIPDSIDNIVNPLHEAIEATRWGRGSNGYRSAYDKYETSINNTRNSAKGLSLDQAQKYKGLEIVALMWQAYLLKDQAGNNVITNNDGLIRVSGLPEIKSDRKINDAYKLYNLLISLQNYEKVEEIWKEAKKHGKEFPYSVNIPKLGERGNIARLDTVYERMKQAVEELERVAPQYGKILQEKRLAIAEKLKSYNNLYGKQR